MAENIEFRLKVIEDQLGAVLSQNEKKAKGLGDTLKVALGTFAGNIATKGVELLGRSFGELTSFVKESIDAASESEQNFRKLEVALAQTGQLTEEASKSFRDFATQIQATTAFEDDLVVTSAALIQSLTRLDVEGLQRATSAAIDLSAALGIDLESASRIVGKAAEGNTVALGKLGIEFQKGVDDAETFANVLASIESRFGGSAQQQAKTFAGSIAQLSNVYGDLKEEIGSIITQNPAVIAAFGVIKNILIDVGNSIKNAFSQENTDRTKTLFNTIIDGAAVTVLAFDSVGRVVTAAFEASLAAINLLALGVVTPIAGILELSASIPGIGEKFKGSADVATAEMQRLSAEVNRGSQAVADAFSGDTALSKLSLDIAEAKSQFNLFYQDVKTKGDDLKNNPVVVAPVEDDADLERQRQLKAELFGIESQFAIDKQLLLEQSRISEKELFLRANLEDLQAVSDFERQKIEAVFLAQQQKNALLKTQAEKETANRIAEINKKSALAKLEIDIEKKKNALIISEREAFFAAASSLASSENRTLAAIGKAAAIGQIAIKTPAAVASSFEYGAFLGGPPLGFAFAGIAATAMAAQAAQIAGIKGFADGGIIGATSGSDNRIATVRDGEMVLNANQQKTLFDAINGGGFGGDIIVQVDGREIARAVRNQVKSGFNLGVA